jgi:hypothetical protein
VVVVALYAVEIWLALLTDVGLFLIPGHVFLVVYAVSWGRCCIGSRGRCTNAMSALRRRIGLEQRRQQAVDGRTPALAVPRSGPL